MSTCYWTTIIPGPMSSTSLTVGVWWCRRCGTIKTGPHSEHGAYGYYAYRRPIPKPDPGEDAPWFDRLGYEYDESKQDIACLRPECASDQRNVDGSVRKADHGPGGSSSDVDLQPG